MKSYDQDLFDQKGEWDPQRDRQELWGSYLMMHLYEGKSDGDLRKEFQVSGHIKSYKELIFMNVFGIRNRSKHKIQLILPNRSRLKFQQNFIKDKSSCDFEKDIVNSAMDNIYSKESLNEFEKLEHQLTVDVIRCFGNIQPQEKLSALFNEKRPFILDCLKTFYLNYPWLSYYQGFHDVVGHLLIHVEDLHLAHSFLEHVVFIKLCDFMHTSFKPTMAYLELIPFILRKIDPPVAKRLTMDIPGFVPHFAVSWIMTWFLHDIKKLETARLLMDLILSPNYLAEFPLYLSCMVILSRRSLLIHRHEPLDHIFLHELIKDMDFDTLIPTILPKTLDYMHTYPIRNFIRKDSIPIELYLTLRRTCLWRNHHHHHHHSNQLGPHHDNKRIFSRDTKIIAVDRIKWEMQHELSTESDYRYYDHPILNRDKLTYFQITFTLIAILLIFWFEIHSYHNLVIFM